MLYRPIKRFPKRIIFICAILLYSTLSWGQSWKLTKTMNAKLLPNSWLIISSTAPSEAMPNFTRKNPGPWKSIRSNFGVHIVGNITSIGNYAFAGCEHLTVIDFVKTPDPNAQKVQGFTVIEDSNCLTSIGEGAFEGCVNFGLKGYGASINFPSSLSSIGNYAFRGCTNLRFISLPPSVTVIGNRAFEGCTGIDIVSVEWKTPLNIPDSVFASLNTANISLYIPTEAKSQYQNTKVWANFRIRTEADIDAVPYDDNPVKNFQIKTGLYINRVIGEKALTFIILSLSVILLLIRISKEDESQQDAGFGISQILMRISLREGYKPRRGAAYVMSTILFLITCLFEILYVSSVDDATWFCSPDRVGWIWTIINFFIFGGIVYNQILYLFDVMGDVLANGNAECNLKMGINTWIVGFIVALLCSFFFKRGLPFVLAAVCILQLIQAALIFSSYGRNIKGAFWGAFVYLFGSIGTVVTLMAFLGILIFVVLGLIVFKFLTDNKSSSSSTSSSNSSDDSNPSSNQYCRTCKYYPGNGYNCGRKYHAGTYDGSMIFENSKACFYWERG